MTTTLPPATAADAETARERLAEEYGQNEHDHDRNPTDDGFVAWLAGQVEALRAELAHRDEPPAPLSTEPGRADYIAGLRALATTLEHHPDLELPYDGRSSSINVMVHGDQRERVAAWARVLPGAKNKRASTNGAYFYLEGRMAGLQIAVIADRGEVCERVVVGTREVTEEVPDPEAVAALPKRTQTRVEEVVEWRCHPVLDDRPSQVG